MMIHYIPSRTPYPQLSWFGLWLGFRHVYYSTLLWVKGRAATLPHV